QLPEYGEGQRVQPQREQDRGVEAERDADEDAQETAHDGEQAVHSPRPGDRATRWVCDRQNAQRERHSADKPHGDYHNARRHDSPGKRQRDDETGAPRKEDDERETADASQVKIRCTQSIGTMPRLSWAFSTATVPSSR